MLVHYVVAENLPQKLTREEYIANESNVCCHNVSYIIVSHYMLLVIDSYVMLDTQRSYFPTGWMWQQAAQRASMCGLSTMVMAP